MMRARALTVAGALSLAAVVNAAGSAIINNNCDHDVYLWPVSVDESPSSPIVIKKNGGSWSQQYKTCSTGGMSLKLSDDEDMSSGITQFEYTLDPGMIWYDISNVNCLPFGTGICPFHSTGMTLTSGSGCPVAKCVPGSETCHDAYTYPKDDWASLACKPSADTTLELCSSSSGSSSSGSGGIIGQVTSLVGGLLGGGDSSSEAQPTTSSTSTPPPAPTTTSTTPTPVAPTPSTTSTTAKASSWSAPAHQAGGAYNDHGAVGIAAVPTEPSSVAPKPSTTSSPTTSSTPTTTLATSTTTPAPAVPNVAVVYETVTEMVATTTVVYQHRMAHKAKRDSTHPHARRHHHQE